MPSIAAAMTPFPHSIDVESTPAVALELMQKHDIHHLPVTDAGTLVGVLAERDLERAASRGPLPASVSPLCRREVLIVDLAEPLDVVLEQMAEGRFDAALVVRRGRLAGIFTVTDACHHFGLFLRDQVHRSGGDDAA